MLIQRSLYVALFAIPALACVAEPAEPAELTPEPETQFRSATWDEFPIVMHGITVNQLSNYTITIDGDPKDLNEIIDVAAYFSVFRPCEDGLTPDLDSFNYSTATAYIDAANTEGLHVHVPLPYLGTLSNICDGVEVSGALWDDSQTIQIPLNKDQINAAYTSYWAGKVGTFIDAVDSYDTNDVVWSWGALDELRYWYATETALARAMRDEVDSHDGTRDLIGYTPNHYMPESSIINTLVDRPHASLSPYDPLTVNVNPSSPVARDAVSGVVDDYYPKSVLVNRDNTGELRQLFDHIWTGAYTGWILGANGHENRIHPYHRAKLSVEARDNLEFIYDENNAEESISQVAPNHMVFHSPDLSALGPDEMTAAEARHDLWAGVHLADGIWIYNFAYHDDSAEHQAVWAEFAKALYLIKSEMRDYLVDGTHPVSSLWHNGAVATVPGDDYLSLGGAYATSDHLALPDSPDPEYNVFNHSLFEIDGVGYLIVTHSWDQEADFEVSFYNCISDVDVVSGTAENLYHNDNILGDTMSGIDGRVYRIEFGGPC